MAEVVGLVASIGALAGAGFKLASTISTLSDGLSTAQDQVRSIAADTKAVAVILHQIKKRLDKSGPVPKHVADVLSDMISVCQNDLDDIQSSLLPLLTSEGVKMMFKQRLLWLLARSKITMRQASLESIKSTLNLFLHAYDLMEEDTMSDYLEEEVKQLMSEPRNVKKMFLDAEHLDHAMEKAFEDCGDGAEFRVDMNARGGSHETSSLEDSAQGSDVQTTQENALMAVGSPKSDSDGQELSLRGQAWDKTNLAPLESISDDHFLVIADHLRLRRDVSNMALVVLRREQPSASSVDIGQPAEGQPGPKAHVPPSVASEATKSRGRQAGATSSQPPPPESQDEPPLVSTPSVFRNSPDFYYEVPTFVESQAGGYFENPFSPPRSQAGGYFGPPDNPFRPRQSEASGFFEPSDNPFHPPQSHNQEWSYQFLGQQPSSMGGNVNSQPHPPWPQTSQGSFGGGGFDPYADPYRDSPPYPHPAPVPSPQTLRDDNERRKLEAELSALKLQQAKREEEEARRHFESDIRKRTEEEYKIREEARKKALEEAKKEFERSKGEAERQALEKMRKEMQKEMEAKKRHEEMVEQIRQETLEAFEREQKAKKKGLRRFL